MTYKLLLIIVFICCFYQFFSMLYQQRNVFLARSYHEQFPALQTIYSQSQYVKKDHPAIIPDETLEAYAGGAFLQGVNPIHIIHDQPPLGRYIIALSIYLFDSAGVLLLFCLMFSLVGIVLLARLVVSNYLFALIPAGIFANEPLFLSKLMYNPLLEPIQLPFIIFMLYFFLRGMESRKYAPFWFMASSLMLGGVISIRFFALGVAELAALYIALAIIFIREKNKKLVLQKTILFSLTLPLSLLVLIASYTKTIIDGASILDVLKIQKYIFVYHKSAFILPFSFWDLLLFNRWHTWWGSNSISSDATWIIVWPLSFLFSFVTVFLGKVKRFGVTNAQIGILAWIFVYCLFLSSGYTSTRYFLPLVPFLYIIAIAFIVNIGKLILPNMLPKNS